MQVDYDLSLDVQDDGAGITSSEALAWRLQIESIAAALPALTQLQALHLGYTVQHERTLRALLQGVACLPRLQDLSLSIAKVPGSVRVCAACFVQLDLTRLDINCELGQMNEQDNYCSLIASLASFSRLQALQLGSRMHNILLAARTRCGPKPAQDPVEAIAKQHPTLSQCFLGLALPYPEPAQLGWAPFTEPVYCALDAE